MVSLGRLQFMEEGLVVGRGGTRSLHGYQEPLHRGERFHAEPVPPPSGSMLEHRFRAVAAEARTRAAWMARSACAVSPVDTLASMLRALGEALRTLDTCEQR
ncbi:MAG: hypothetical protein HY904_07830 [Deltaproteobacteria bacterium]|nr:hypothetical protein [Deltaproteobacteria bacterium]